MIVVDASALIEVLTRSDRGQRIESRILRPSETVHAPALIDLEVAQVLRRYASTGQVPQHWARMAMEIAIAFPMTRYLHEPLMKRVWHSAWKMTLPPCAGPEFGPSMQKKFGNPGTATPR